MARLLLSMVWAVPAVAHGVLTKAVSGSQKACAVNTPFQCGSGDKLRFREVIPRSGNTGVCANPPGCEASFKCDWCGLEKSNALGTTIGGKWWTTNPATHWDNPAVWPQNVCMSNQGFGAGGKMDVAKGGKITTTFYVNADHSGLYQFQLSCGTEHTNQKFMDRPITPWKMLHENKEFNQGRTVSDRVVGSTRQQTDAHFQQTVCVGAACNYRMNRNVQGAESEHCRNNPWDCFIEDEVTIPADFACSGDATLRWFWLSSEGAEIYANCLDLNIQGGSTPSTPTPAPAPVGTCPASGDCHNDPGCCPANTKCFEKDQYWGSCMSSCTPGINPNDPPQYQTDWSCKVLTAGSTPSQPATCATQRWGQCGGKDYSGPTCCKPSDSCKFHNQWYSQCVPAGSAYVTAASSVLGETQTEVVNCTAEDYFPLQMGLEVACDCEFGLPEGGCLSRVCSVSQTKASCLLSAENAAKCSQGSEVGAALAGCEASGASMLLFDVTALGLLFLAKTLA